MPISTASTCQNSLLRIFSPPYGRIGNSRNIGLYWRDRIHGTDPVSPYLALPYYSSIGSDGIPTLSVCVSLKTAHSHAIDDRSSLAYSLLAYSTHLFNLFLW